MGERRRRAEVRETSSATTRLVLGYVRERAGEGAVAEVLRRAEVDYTADELQSDSHWVSYEARIRLFEATTEVLGDPRVMFEVGASVLRQQITPSLVLLLRALGSPERAFRQLPRAVAKFSTTSTMTIADSSATSATISYVLHPGYVHSRLDCLYAQGLFSVVPSVFGLPPAQILHDTCESDGATACHYEVSWPRWSRWRQFRLPRAKDADPELVALRAQLAALQSAASELVGTEDLDGLLARIVERAAAAVLAQGYLLAVRSPYGGPPLVHAAGVSPPRAAALADALLSGVDVDASITAVDVASARRHHGRLAAVFAPGQRGLTDEHRLLEAYAGHAAAALDMIIALENSRRGERRAHALLALSHQLARADDVEVVTEVIATALPEIVGCSSSGVFLWDAEAHALRGTACSGFDDERAALVKSIALRPQDTPELVRMLASHEPVVLDAEHVEPTLQRLFGGLGVEHVIAVPLLVAGELIGVLTASWGERQDVRERDEDSRLRLEGVGDQATTALQNARLLGAIRHQALHDPLTGLPNRVLFADRMEQALRRLDRADPDADQVAVLFCDLDRFKQVNDVLGHAAGDDLLRQVAKRLTAAVRDGDTVGRLSGDEFALLLPSVADLGEALRVADRIRDSFRSPFLVEECELSVSTSIGVAIHDAPHGSVDVLLRRADADMYQEKQRIREPLGRPVHAVLA